MGYSSYCVHIIMVCIYYHAVWCISSPIKAFHSICYTHVIFLRAILMYINQFKAPAKHVKISFFKNILICFRSWVLVCGCIFKTLLKISAVGGGVYGHSGYNGGRPSTVINSVSFLPPCRPPATHISQCYLVFYF